MGISEHVVCDILLKTYILCLIMSYRGLTSEQALQYFQSLPEDDSEGDDLDLCSDSDEEYVPKNVASSESEGDVDEPQEISSGNLPLFARTEAGECSRKYTNQYFCNFSL